MRITPSWWNNETQQSNTAPLRFVVRSRFSEREPNTPALFLQSAGANIQDFTYVVDIPHLCTRHANADGARQFR
jgi:hypothetical protein